MKSRSIKFKTSLPFQHFTFVAFFGLLFSMLSVSISETAFAQPASLVVDTNIDETNDGECDIDCTLREALGLIASGGTITFDTALDGATIALTQGELDIMRSLRVDASPLASGLTVDAQQNSRVFEVTDGAASGEGAILIGLTITGGYTEFSGGGGIFSRGTLTLRASTVSGNIAAAGGGINLGDTGTLILQNTTVSGNEAAYAGGGGIWASSDLLIENSTVASNTGGGLHMYSGSAELRNSVLAGTSGDADCTALDGSSITASYTFVEDGSCITSGVDGNLSGDPLLGPLGDNGGTTNTHQPQEDSPLLGAGDEATCLDTDQRGENRPQPNGTACDIGAVEVEQYVFVPPTELVVDTNADETDDGECETDCTLREALGLIDSGGTITFSFTGTINLTGALPDLARDVTIEGPGADLLTVRRDTGGDYRIFTIPSGVTVTISGLTIANGESNSRGARDGGGIHNAGILTLDACTLIGNRAYYKGGAILNASSGDLKIINSTLSGNRTVYYGGTEGGAIYNNGTLLVEQSTFSGNAGYGGASGVDGIQHAEGTTAIRNSTFLSGSSTTTTLSRGNGTVTVFNSVFMRTSGSANFSGEITSLGYNMCSDDCSLSATGDQTNTDPLLADLTANGGPTLTHLPEPFSPLIDAGSCPSATTDQRGETRPDPVNGLCDVGAVEYQNPPQNTLVVDTNTDETDDGECDDDCTLREALGLIASGGIITFSVTGTINLTGALPDLARDVTIEGPGADLLTLRRSTGGDYRIFTIPSGLTVAFSGLTISDGNIPGDSGQGGGIHNAGTLTLNASALTGSKAFRGGGIYNSPSGNLTITNSTLSGNQSLEYSGDGGAIYNDGTLLVEQSTFSGNYSMSNAMNIANPGSGSTATIRHSTFRTNYIGPYTPSSLRRGGGTITVYNSAFEKLGGGKNFSGEITSLGYNACNDNCGLNATGDQNNAGSLFLGPLTDNGGPTNTHVPAPFSPLVDAGSCPDATADQRGETRPAPVSGLCDVGAVEQQNPPRDALVVDTPADEANDGECDEDCTLREAITLINPGGTITFDTALDGETILLTQNQLEIFWPMTINASALPSGLTLDAQRKSSVLDVRDLTNGDEASVLIGLTLTGGKTGSDNRGTGIRVEEANLTLNQSTVSGNGARFEYGGGVFLSNGTLTLERSTVSGNPGDDGGITVVTGSLLMEHSTVSGNGYRGGGGIYLETATATIANSTIANNTNRTSTAPGIHTTTGSTVTLSNTVINGNTSTGSSVQCSVDGSVTASHTLVEDGSCITPDENGNLSGDPLLGALADNGGPTLTHLPQPGSPLLDAGSCADATTDQRGEPRPDPNGSGCDIGSVEVQQLLTSLVVDTALDEADDGECDDDCTLREALGLVAGGGTITFNSALDGQTIELTEGQLEITRPFTVDASMLAGGLTVDAGGNSRVLLMTETTAEGDGAILVGITLTGGFTEDDFAKTKENKPQSVQTSLAAASLVSSRDGAGLYNLGTLTLRQVTVSDNAADGTAGGIYNEGTLTLEESTVSSNTAVEGGGIVSLLGSTLIVLRSTISNNSGGTVEAGGGILSASTLSVESSTISGNTAGYGGALAQFGGPEVHVQNSTIWGNKAQNTSAGIYVRSEGTIRVTNTVVGGGTGADDCFTGSSGEIIATYSLIGDGSCITPGTDGNLSGDPQLGNLADNGGPTLTHLPMAGSPLIDAGDPTTLPGNFLTDEEGNPIDQAGNPRFTGAAIDIGAVETDGLSVSLAGSEGFRALSAPAETSLADLLAPIWTQGIPGTDDSSGDANLWLWNNGYAGNDTGGWTIPSDVSTTTLNPGEGVLVYVFEDDQPGTPGSWPKTLSVSGTVPDLPFSGFTFNTNSGGFTLLGNPAVSNIDWDEVTSSNLDDAVYVWDPSSGADGQWLSYVNGSGDLTGGIISPFQGFMVRTNGAGPSLEISQTTTAGTFYGKESAGEGPVAMRLQLDGQELTSSAWLYLTEDGSLMEDAGDALKLQPFATEYALLSTVSSDGVLMDINHLPLETDTAIHLPLNVEATRNGSFTLTNTQMNLPDGWSAVLRDHQTGKEMTVNENSEYTFEIENSLLKRGAKGGVYSTPASLLPQPLKAKTGGNGTASRFTLTIAPQGVDIQSSTLPEEFVLSQNYPNPFNPSTVISYQLPVNSEVRLEVYDMLGRNVATLVNEPVAAGRHTVNFDASGLSSGVYLYRLQAGSTIITKKLTVVK